MRLLYIESSPRKKRSASIEVSKVFIDSFKLHYPSAIVETLDLWETELPPFDGDVIDSKYAIMHGQPFTDDQKKSWEAVEKVIETFKVADVYLFSIPMWNFLIPYKLKHYIDVIVQPGYTFSFSPSEGYKGLVKEKPAYVIYSRGGAYGPGSGAEAFDFQKRYFEEFLHFIGFTEIHSIYVEPTLSSPEVKELMMERVKKEAADLAAHVNLEKGLQVS